MYITIHNNNIIIILLNIKAYVNYIKIFKLYHMIIMLFIIIYIFIFFNFKSTAFFSF